MVRLLGLGLVAVLVFVIGSGQRAPLTQGEYVALVRNVGKDVDDLELFENVVNSDVLALPGLLPRPGLRPRQRTAPLRTTASRPD
jgi:hypothetical protein